MKDLEYTTHTIAEEFTKKKHEIQRRLTRKRGDKLKAERAKGTIKPVKETAIVADADSTDWRRVRRLDDLPDELKD